STTSAWIAAASPELPTRASTVSGWAGIFASSVNATPMVLEPTSSPSARRSLSLDSLIGADPGGYHATHVAEFIDGCRRNQRKNEGPVGGAYRAWAQIAGLLVASGGGGDQRDEGGGNHQSSTESKLSTPASRVGNV